MKGSVWVGNAQVFASVPEGVTETAPSVNSTTSVTETESDIVTLTPETEVVFVQLTSQTPIVSTNNVIEMYLQIVDEANSTYYNVTDGETEREPDY